MHHVKHTWNERCPSGQEYSPGWEYLWRQTQRKQHGVRMCPELNKGLLPLSFECVIPIGQASLQFPALKGSWLGPSILLETTQSVWNFRSRIARAANTKLISSTNSTRSIQLCRVSTTDSSCSFQCDCYWIKCAVTQQNHGSILLLSHAL